MKSEKFQNKYSIQSARLQTWDYSWAASYFITICTKKREHYFGTVDNNRMILSNLGILADVFWHEIKPHSPNVELGNFVVMPNHIHGIIILHGNPNPIIETEQSITTNDIPETIGSRRYQNQGKNTISSIVGGYKAAVTKHANRLGIPFAWQASFHEHIIRDSKSFEEISTYILNNPILWCRDMYNVNF